MALARLALGRLYFERADYDHAQPCYAEAVALLPETFEGIRQIRDRSDVLDELLPYIPAPSASTTRSAARRHARDRPAQSDRRHHRAPAPRRAGQSRRGGTTATGGGGRRQQRRDRRFHHLGQRIGAHGIHPPERRRVMVFLQPSGHRGGPRQNSAAAGARANRKTTGAAASKAAYAAIDGTDTNDDPQGAQSATAASDPHERAYYLAQIPADSLSRKKAHDAIQEGLFNMGLILKDKLDDYTEARRHWDRLLRQYPDNIYRPELYHNLYLMAARMGDNAEAERWRLLMAGEFADTPLGKAMANPDYLRDLKEMHSRQEQLYAAAYEAYLANDNDSVRSAAEYARTHYPTSQILPKFLFIDALTLRHAGRRRRVPLAAGNIWWRHIPRPIWLRLPRDGCAKASKGARSTVRAPMCAA